MAQGTARFRGPRWRLVAIVPLLVLTVAGVAAGAPASPIASQPPPGFEDLLRPQQTLVDVYLGGVQLGVARVTYRPGHLTFDEPAKVAALLPRLIDPKAVATALTGELPSHAELLCRDGGPAGCGELSPDVAGVIFDESRFTVEVFVNQRQLAVVGAGGPRYLPEPTAGGSLVSSLAGAVSGAGGDAPSFGVQSRTIVAWRTARFTAEVADSSDEGFQVETLAAQLDRPGLRYQAGLFWAPAFDFTGQARMYGAGFGAQFDTRADADQFAGAPLVVFLAHRSQVDILRDGRLLSSRLYDAGNQTLDTTYLPDGAYRVTLRIHDVDGGTHDVQQFFVKSHAMPPPDSPGFFVEAGVLAADTGSGLPAADKRLLIEAGYSRRLDGGDSAGVDALMLGSTVLGEVGLTHFDRLVSLHAAALTSSDGNYGVLFDGALTGIPRLVVSLDVRKTWGPGLQAIGGGQPADVFSSVTQTNLLSGAALQATGNVSYVYKGAQLGFTATYFRTAGSPRSYAYGPQLTWPFWQGAHAVATLAANFTKSSDGYQGMLSLRLQLFKGRSSMTAEAGGAAENGALTGRKAGPVASVVGDYVMPGVLSSALTLSGQASHTLDGDVLGGGAELRGAYGDFLGQVEDDSGAGQGADLHYSANFATSVAVSAGGVAIGGADVAASGVIAQLSGAPPDLVAEVLVDGAPAARLHGARSAPIFLAPYRVYRISLRPVSGPAVAFDDDRDRRVSLDPGNIQTLAWKVTPVFAVFGRALDSTGRPIAAATIEGAREPAETDDGGYFQAEVAAGAKLTLRPAVGGACRISLPTAAVAGQAFAPLGDVVCARVLP
jgi:hypothetical protein